VRDAEPHLSVVAVSRNDNHGGDMLGRMQLFVDGFFAQCKRHQLRAELILVEWNPPPDRAPLAEALTWPTDPGPAAARIVTVPADVHSSLPHSEALPLFQMLGKNVGIRRARGEFVLATNVDILLDDNLVRYLRDSLSPRTSVRVDRFDVPADVARSTDFAVTLADCRARFFYSQTRNGIFDTATETILAPRQTRALQWSAIRYALGLTRNGAYHERRAMPFNRSKVTTLQRLAAALLGIAAKTAAGGLAGDGKKKKKTKPRVTLARRAKIATSQVARYQRKWRLFWRSMRRVSRTQLPAVAKLVAAARLAQLVVSAPNLKRSRVWMKRSRIWIPGWQPRSIARRLGRLLNGRRTMLRPPHTMACGDFTLLSRDDWFGLRGYPEWPMYSWHLDSVFLYAAQAVGIREVALDSRYRMYHIDHSAGWSPEAANQLFDRLRSRGIPFMADIELNRYWSRFMRRPETCVVNGEDWGFPDRCLPETWVAGGPGVGVAANAVR